MNEPEMVKAMVKIGETVGDIFGGYPFKNYWFLSNFRLIPSRGGLEHRNSTMIHGTSDQYRERAQWENFERLVIHEYFHAWNVKAIQDTALRQGIDYQNETYTKLLWVHEGWTNFYHAQVMMRAGFWDDKRLLKDWADKITSMRDTPGHKVQSLSDASFHAWIHYYRKTETRNNSQVSYYRGGALSALCLDLMIRHQTKNRKSLDDVMRHLYQDYAVEGKGISIEAINQVLDTMVGSAGRNFLDHYVHKPNSLPFEDMLSYAGIRMEYVDPDKKDKKDGDSKDQAEDKKDGAQGKKAKTPPKPKPFKPHPPVELGVKTYFRESAVVVSDVPRDGMGWQAGLDFGDEILAINKRRISKHNFKKSLAWFMPGEKVMLLVNRGNKILEIELTLPEKPKKLKLVLRKDADDLQRSIYNSLFKGVKQ